MPLPIRSVVVRLPATSSRLQVVTISRGQAVPASSAATSMLGLRRRAKPLVSYRVIVELISATTTKTGLTVHCELDAGQYPKGIVVSDAETAAINIKRAEFHGEWNYTISPNTHPPNHALIS